MGENTNHCETEDPKTKITVLNNDVESEERKNKNTTVRLGPALTDFIKRYRQEHPECTSDSAAADRLLEDGTIKSLKIGKFYRIPKQNLEEYIFSNSDISHQGDNS